MKTLIFFTATTILFALVVAQENLVEAIDDADVEVNDALRESGIAEKIKLDLSEPIYETKVYYRGCTAWSRCVNGWQTRTCKTPWGWEFVQKRPCCTKWSAWTPCKKCKTWRYCLNWPYMIQSRECPYECCSNCCPALGSFCPSSAENMILDLSHCCCQGYGCHFYKCWDNKWMCHEKCH